MAASSGQSSFDPYDLSSNDEKNWTPKNVAESLPAQSDHTARLMIVTRLYLNSLPEASKNWVQVYANPIHYHSDPMEIGSECRL